MSLELAWPGWLGALPLPWLAARWLPPAPPAAAAALELPYPELLELGPGRGGTPVSRLDTALALLAWLLLVLAAARPLLVGEAIELPVNGRDLMLAIDLSGSMQAEDMVIDGRPASRLAAVKRVASDFIARRKGDRLGLILFGDRPYLQTPLTFDTHSVQAQLAEAVLGLAGKRTAIGDTIGLAIKRLREQSRENRVLLLLTDGTNTAGELDPVEAAELAGRQGIRIYTIGIGSDRLRGHRAPSDSRELDEATLSAIARATGGRFFRARDGAELEQVYRVIDTIEPVDKEPEVFRPLRELYGWPLAAALLLSLVLAGRRLAGGRGEAGPGRIRTLWRGWRHA